MMKSTKRKKGSAAPVRHANLDLAADAWPRFEALIKSAAKMGHKPHVKPKPKRRKANA
jgi:hypothetical protein